MRIAFTALGCGYGNNGGTKTIVSCANVLTELGHEVYLVADKYNYTWSKCVARITKEYSKDLDVIIATGINSVPPLLEFKTKAKKIWYVRGWENWSQSDEKILELCKKIRIITNARWLSNRIGRFNSYPPVVYPGLDLDIFYSRNFARTGITIGGLYHERGYKRFDLFKRTINEIRKTEKIRVITFGVNDVKFNTCSYYRSPDSEKLNWIYNECDIWMFTSQTEGLHIPPMEAGLCGCAIAGMDIGGVRDYAIHKETALLARTPEKLIEYTKYLIKNHEFRQKLAKNLQKRLISYIGNRKSNMLKFVDVISIL